MVKVMKYLFFDIECSNCFNGIGKICEFGYVLTDENFNIIKQDDIPMSPGKGRDNRFYLKGRKHEKDIELAYDYDDYFKQPEFYKFYDRIKKIMEDPDTICFAFSMENDINHLYNACTRYKLEPLNYICYDVQLFVKKYLEKKNLMSLKNACHEIVGPHSTVQLQEHLSRDDAKMEMMIFEAICILQQVKSIELLKDLSFAKTNSIEFIKRIKETKEKKKLKKAGQDLYNSLVSSDLELDNLENIGKRYIIGGAIKSDLDTLKATIEMIKSNGGILSKQIDKSDYFIVYDENNKRNVIKNFKHPFECQILTYQEFKNKNNSQ